MSTAHDGGDGSGTGDDKPTSRPPAPRSTTTGATRPKLAQVVLLPERREVTPRFADDLRASGLTDETVALARLYVESHSKRLAALVQRRTWGSLQGPALVFPFYLPTDGVDAEPHAYRVKPTRPRLVRKRNGKERPVKYDQASEYGLLVYFPPRARIEAWYRDTSHPLYWTEGEKKALALDQLGLACVGLCGVWNWIDQEYKETTRGERLTPVLAEHIAVAGRSHVIVYDADVAEKPDAMLGARRLAGVLLAAGASEVRFVVPPDVATAKGIDDYLGLHGEQATRAVLETAGPIEPADPKQPLARLRSAKALRESPLDESLLMPDEYEVRADGSLWRSSHSAKRGDEQVTHTPLYAVRRLVEHYTGDERVDLMYSAGEQWRAICASRKAVSDARAMVAELAPYGVPVTSNTASKIVDWLDAYMHANDNGIPRVACVSTCGWHVVDGERIFVTHEARTREDGGVRIAVDTRGDRKKLVEALTPRGSLERHLDALRLAWNADPICAAMICAAFAATLLEPLHASNFAVHLPGESSRGKTSMLKIAASVFGDPSSTHWIASWNVTPTGAEMRAALLCDLPQCYDEIGGGDPQATERLVYSLINGGGKTRSSKELGLRETQSWRAIILSTGERELADEQAATGAQVRVVQLPVAGFGKLTAVEIDAMRDECGANAGRAGDEWLKSLVETDAEQWKPLRKALANATANMRRKASDPLQGRVASYFALLAVTESVLHTTLDLGDAEGGTMHRLYESISSREPVQGIADKARELVEGWLLAEPDGFPELEMSSTTGEDDDPKSRGKVRHGFRKGETLYLLPSAFRDFCERHRLTARAVVREWLRLGWSQCDVGRLDKLHRIGATRARFYTLTLTREDALTEVNP